MKVQTVRGDLSPEELSVTLPHEHVFIDWRAGVTESFAVTRKSLAETKVDITNLGELRLDFSAIKDNLVLDDFELAVEELLYYKRAGGKSLVDCTSDDIGRDPIALREISEITGLNIICGCGHYTEKAHPKYLKECSIEDLVDEILKDITEGIGETDIKAGIIGEIGVTGNMSQNEEKVLRAAVRAQKETGAAISVHFTPTDLQKPYQQLIELYSKALKVLEDEGANLEKVIMCHQDDLFDVEHHMPDYKHHEKMAEKGVYIEYDCFGSLFWRFAGDIARIDAVIKLIDDGYLNQILISQDICTKANLKKYGGFGYAHILRTIVPTLKSKGISKNEIHTLLVENPKKALSF